MQLTGKRLTVMLFQRVRIGMMLGNVTQDVGKAIQMAFRKIENANSDKLTGIFGDGTWTNKDPLSDRLLKDLLEHFSTKNIIA